MPTMWTGPVGSFLSEIGEVKPDTIKLLHEREKLETDKSYQQALEGYYKSLMGQASARMELEQQRLREPIGYAPGTALFRPGEEKPYYTVPTKPGYQELHATELEKKHKEAIDITKGPWTYEEKYSRIGGLGLNPRNYLVAPKETVDKSLTEEQLTRTALFDPDPNKRKEAQAILDSMQKRKLDISRQQRAISEAEPFNSWDYNDRETAFLDKYYSGRDPRFAWGDRRSYSQFQQGYYHWMRTTGRNPIGAITERSDIRSYQGALNDITKREALINTFVDRIEANANVVRAVQKKYGLNKDGVLMNQARNLVLSRTMGSGELESLRLALFSLSAEVAKVETNALGIGEISVSAREIMGRIHSENLNMNDLEKVIETSTWLGQTSREALRVTRDNIRYRLSTVSPPSQEPTTYTPPPPPPFISPGSSEEIPPTVLQQLNALGPVKEGRTAGNGKYIFRGGKWQMERK